METIYLIGFVAVALFFIIVPGFVFSKLKKREGNRVNTTIETIDSLIHNYPEMVQYFSVLDNQIQVLPDLILYRRLWAASPKEARDPVEPKLLFHPNIELPAIVIWESKNNVFIFAHHIEWGCYEKITVSAITAMLKKLGLEHTEYYVKYSEYNNKLEKKYSSENRSLYWKDDIPPHATALNADDLMSALSLICSAMHKNYNSFFDSEFRTEFNQITGLMPVKAAAFASLFNMISASAAKATNEAYRKAQTVVAFNNIVSYFIAKYGSEISF